MEKQVIAVMTGNAIITGVKRGTKAQLFKDLRIGDTLLFTMDLKRIKWYAPMVKVTCIRTMESVTLAQNVVARRLEDNFEYQPGTNLPEGTKYQTP